MLSFDEAEHLLKTRSDVSTIKLNDCRGKEFLKITSMARDSFLKEIAPCYLVVSKADEGILSQIIAYTYKRGKIKDAVLSTEQINVFLEMMMSLKPCQGIDPEKASLIKAADLMSEMFDSRSILRHRKCHVVIKEGTTCEACSPSTKRRKVANKPLLQCDVCDLDFTSKILLDQHHRRNHSTSDKKWMCKFDGCLRAFKRQETLKNHHRTHSRDVFFICQLCSARFTRKGTLTAHIRRSHGDQNESKSWSCADCPKLFFTRQQLERHRRIHVGDKPFTCEKCNKSFSRSHHLSRHSKSMHAPNNTFTLEYELYDDQGKHHTVIQMIPRK